MSAICESASPAFTGLKKLKVDHLPLHFYIVHLHFSSSPSPSPSRQASHVEVQIARFRPPNSVHNLAWLADAAMTRDITFLNEAYPAKMFK